MPTIVKTELQLHWLSRTPLDLVGFGNRTLQIENCPWDLFWWCRMIKDDLGRNWVDGELSSVFE